MSDSFYIVNFEKREYIEPMAFGDFEGIRGYMIGRHAQAVAILVSDPGIILNHFHSSLPGSWCGNRIGAVFSSMLPDTEGYVTSTPTEPTRNLYLMIWEEYANITHECLSVLCDWDELAADDLAQMAAGDSYQLWDLRKALSTRPCPTLESAMLRHVGPDWKRMCDDFQRELGEARE